MNGGPTTEGGEIKAFSERLKEATLAGAFVAGVPLAGDAVINGINP